jgi:hypothetical protein
VGLQCIRGSHKETICRGGRVKEKEESLGFKLLKDLTMVMISYRSDMCLRVSQFEGRSACRC